MTYPALELINQLQASDNKTHAFFTWVCDKLEELSTYLDKSSNDDDHDGSGKESCVSDHSKVVILVIDQLNEFIRFQVDQEESGDYFEICSHYSYLRAAQLYLYCLIYLEQQQQRKVYDSTEFLCSVLADDISIEHEIAEPKKVSKRKSNKKKHLYAPAKDLSTTILIQLFHNFGNEISSFISMATNAIFKNLKKVLEKKKNYHATFMTLLVQLLDTILSNCDKSDIDPGIITKLTKLCKTIIERMSNRSEDFPVDFVAAIIKLWAFCSMHQSFIKDNMNPLSWFQSKFCEGELTILGYSNDHTRSCVAQAIATCLFRWLRNGNIPDNKEVWKFYSNLLMDSDNREAVVCFFESIVQYVSLNMSYDEDFLEGLNYLSLVRELGQIFDKANIKGRTMTFLSRLLRYFDHMHNSLLPHISDNSKTQMFVVLFETDTEVDDISEASSGANSQWIKIMHLSLASTLLDHLAPSFISVKHDVQVVLDYYVSLSISDVFMIRIYSAKVVQKLLIKFPEYQSKSIERFLISLQTGFKMKDQFNFAKNHGYALLISSVMGFVDKDCVDYDLIMRVTVFATSFIKANTTSTKAELYFKGLICWILIIGLMRYDDKQYLLMQTSQLFLFWKVLLTHSFAYNDEETLYRNLEIRNHSLTCLLAYLSNAPFNYDVAKQVSYLLVKCSNFNNSVEMKTSGIDTALLQNENRILQIYLKISDYVKTDFNSSLLILITKNFSDAHLYNDEIPKSPSILNKNKAKKSFIREKTETEVIYEYTVDSILRQSNGFAYGLSSKITNDGVADLGIRHGKRTISPILGHLECASLYWDSFFEAEITKPITNTFSLDYLLALYGPGFYSGSEVYAPKLATSLIDLSIEVFSNVFPYLNNKIQYSVIENLNLSMFSKLSPQFRVVAVSANICVALQSTLKIIHENSLRLEKEVVSLLAESIQKIEFFNDTFISSLKADCIGLLIAITRKNLLEKEQPAYVKEQCEHYIKNVVETQEPYLRMFHSLTLASIFKYNSSELNEKVVIDFILALVNDPHPVVHSWSLRSLKICLEYCNTMDTASIENIVDVIERCLINDDFGMYGYSTLKFNYNKSFSSYLAIGKVLKTLVQNFGPTVSEMKQYSLKIFRNIATSNAISDDLALRKNGLEIYQDTAIWKMDSLLSSTIFIKVAQKTVLNSLSVGYGLSKFYSIYELHSSPNWHTSSMRASDYVFLLFTQLLRLQKHDLLTRSFEQIMWWSYALYPDHEYMNSYLHDILLSNSADVSWFDRVYRFYHMSKKVLFEPYQTAQKRNVIRALDESDELTSNSKGNIIELSTKGALDNGESTVNSHRYDICWRSKVGAVKALLHLFDNINRYPDKHRVVLIHLNDRISDIIELSYNISLYDTKEVKLMAIRILKFVLRHLSDNLEAEKSLQSVFSQYEAQFTGTIGSLMESTYSPDIVAPLIEVCAQMISSNLNGDFETSRAFKYMVEKLSILGNELSGNSYQSNQSAGERKIRYAVLNSWASIINSALEAEISDFDKIYGDYLPVLLPLWLVELREFLMRKYQTSESVASPNSGQNTDEYCHLSWSRVIFTLGYLLKNGYRTQVSGFLGDKETYTFLSVLLFNCMEALLVDIDDPINRYGTLRAIGILLSSYPDYDLLFRPEICAEMIGTLERVIVIGDQDDKASVIKIIDLLCDAYFVHNNGDREEQIDVLYEYLRLLLLVGSQILPIIKLDVMSINAMPVLLSTDIKLLELAFGSLAKIVGRMRHPFRLDMNAIILFIMGKILGCSRCNELVGCALPLLQCVINDSRDISANDKLITTFYVSCKNLITNSLSLDNKFSVLRVYLERNYSILEEDEISALVDEILEECSNSGRASKYYSTIVWLSRHSHVAACRQVVAVMLSKICSFQMENDPKMSAKYVSYVKVLSIIIREVSIEESTGKKALISIFIDFLLRVRRCTGESDSLLAYEFDNILKGKEDLLLAIIEEKLEPKSLEELEQFLKAQDVANDSVALQKIQLKLFK